MRAARGIRRIVVPLMREPHRWSSLALGGVLLAYPLVVYFGMTYFGVRSIALALIAVCCIRLLAFRFMRARSFGGVELALVCAGGIAVAVVGILRDSQDPMLLYPVIVNAVMLFVFASSLVRPPTVVERIARLKDPDLPAEANGYLRGVTIAWVVFFVCNGAIALYTALASSLETWTLYNGFIAYLLIGAMFGGELLTRTRVMRRHAR
jgi:uncharacterized membrane protein